MPFGVTYNKWIYNTSVSPARLQVNTLAYPSGPGTTPAQNSWPFLRHTGASYSYSSTKTYQIVTHTYNHYARHASFSVSPGAWDDFLSYVSGLTADRKSTRLNSSHVSESRMPSSA